LRPPQGAAYARFVRQHAHMKTTISLFTAALLLFATQSVRAQVARSTLPSWAIDNVGHLVPGLMIVRGVKLDMSERDVRSQLGVPDSAIEGYSEMLDSTITLYYKDAEVFLDQHGVQNFDCWGVGCHLPDSVGVGSPLRQVVRSLGRGHPGYGPDPTSSLFYHPPRCDCWLEVRFDSNQHVTRLSLANDNS
jgi:hypothetical protein